MGTRRKAALAASSAIALAAGVTSFAVLQSWECQVVYGSIGEPPSTTPPDGRPVKGVTMVEPLVRPARGWECARQALTHDPAL